MSKKYELYVQSKTLKSSNTISTLKNNKINENLSIETNYNNTYKRGSSIIYLKDSFNSNLFNSQIISPNRKYFKIEDGFKSKPKSKNVLGINYLTKSEGNEFEKKKSLNRLNYKNENLDTSKNENNENNNKDIENEIKKNNDIYKSLILSYNDKLKANNKYKNEFINFLNQYKKQFKYFNKEINNKKKEFDE